MSPPQHEARQRARDLAGLRHHWGSAYEIAWDAGEFLAVRRDTGAAVRRCTASELEEEIRVDYAVIAASAVNMRRPP